MKLAMVGIIVSEMEKAISFYECLGLTVQQRYGEDYVELANKTIRISLNTKKMIEGVYGFRPSLSGERIELAFELDSASAVDAMCLKLTQENHEIIKQPWAAPWGQYYALVADVDGNILSLFVDLPEK